MSNNLRNLTRKQLGEFLPDPRAVRTFEQMLKQLADLIPADLENLNNSVTAAQTAADQAKIAADDAQQSADIASEGFTLAAQALAQLAQMAGFVYLDANPVPQTNNSTTTDYLDISTTAPQAIDVAGRLRWDDAQGTLALGMTGSIVNRVGQALMGRVTNAEAVTITKGQPVYLFQAQGNRATVKLADNTSDATSAKTFGLAAEDIAAGQAGFVMCQGVLDKINTSAFAEGDTLYLGNTAGTLTATKPKAPNHLVYVGVVERSNSGNGQIYVKTQNGYELDEIHDCQITNPATGDLLRFDATVNLWKNYGAGVTGTFKSGDTPQKTISVTNGIITGIT